jgi:hypothetical protein
MSGMLLLSMLRADPQVLRTAQMTLITRTILSCSVGTSGVNGNAYKIACCIIMRFPMKRPIPKPVRELLITRTRAS